MVTGTIRQVNQRRRRSASRDAARITMKRRSLQRTLHRHCREAGPGSTPLWATSARLPAWPKWPFPGLARKVAVPFDDT